MENKSFIIYPVFLPIFFSALIIIVPLFITAFVLYFYFIEGISLFDMLQSWQIFISPSLLPSCIVSAVLVAFVMAFISRNLLSFEVFAEGLLLTSNVDELIKWQDIQTMQQQNLLMLEVVYICINNDQRRYYLASGLWQRGLADTNGKININEIEALIAKICKNDAPFNKNF